MKVPLFIIFLILNLPWWLFAQGKPCSDRVYLDIEKRMFIIDKLSDTFFIKLDNKSYLRVFAADCKGQMYFEKRRLGDSSLVLTGFYKAGKSKFRNTVIIPDLITNPYGLKTRKEIYYYYRPARAKKWCFYDKKGKNVVRKVIYGQ